MTAKRDLRETTFKAEHRIAAMFSRFGRAVVQSVTKHAEGGTVTPKARILILHDVDAALDAIYPTQPGGESALETLILDATAEATRQAMGMRWRLGSGHPKPDACDIYAEHGVYAINDFPSLPEHPCCMCWAETQYSDDLDAVVDGLKGLFRR